MASTRTITGTYTIDRQFDTLQEWSDCVTFVTSPCAYFPVASASLVADHRREIGIAYDDATPSFTDGVDIPLATTDADHYITLTVDPRTDTMAPPARGWWSTARTSAAAPAGSRPSPTTRSSSGWRSRVSLARARRGIRVREANNVLFRNILSHRTTPTASPSPGASPAA